MQKRFPKLSEFISFAVMLLMFVALAAGESGEMVRNAGPSLEVSAEFEYFRGEDE